MASGWPSRRLAWLVLLALVGAAAPAGAQVFMTKEEALAWAFPGADRVDSESFVLTDDQVARVEARSRSKVASKLVTLYTGVKDGAPLGYAFIDVHTVRTLPEAFLVVLSPEGEVRRLRVLAFHEPREYMPPDRWLEQFEGKDGGAPLRLQRDIHGIAGATLSSQAVTGGIRRALALHEILVRQGG